MSVVHPLDRAWITTGGTGAQNYDEFADDAEITAIVEANPYSALAVEMPHWAPDSRTATLAEALPAAVDRLAEAKQRGYYRSAEQVIVGYRITEPSTGAVGYGLFCLVDTDQISTQADEPGLVVRNEDVFVEKVRERVALADAIGHLLSPVLLLHAPRGTGGGAAGAPTSALHAKLAAACEGAGTPAASDVDQTGRVHEIWPIGPVADELCELAASEELVVADGNHRSLAAQTGGLDRFLAVITTPESVTIQPYHRLVHELPTSMDEVLERLTARGADVSPLSDPPDTPAAAGVIHLYGGNGGNGGDGAYAVRLPAAPDATVVQRMDHALVERQLLSETLGLDPGDKRITYVGGDYPPSWLRAAVDTGDAQLAILIAPVGVADFVEVNLNRQKLPRKSTWFTPKARAGLVLTELPR